MMRSMMLTAAVLALLAGCGPSGGSAAGEDALATKIVEAQGVLDLGEDTLKQVIGAQMQSVAFEHPDISPEQAEKLSAAIRKNIEAEMPGLKKNISGFLTEAFDQKELQTYYDFVGSKEGDTIKDRIPPVMQKSLEAADAMTTKAVEKAVAEVMGPAPADPAALAAPGATPAPAPAPEPAKPTKPQ
jgi:hypothetical protein